jgi:long-chain acyl-CoA synthetase
MANNAWLKNYDRGVPPTLEPYPESTILDAFTSTVKQKPGHTCVIFKGSHICYGDMDGMSNAIASALAALGVTRGDTIAILLPNSPETVISQIAIWKAGGIPVPLNPLYTEEELENGISQCGARVAIVYGTLYPIIKSFQSRHPRLKTVIPVEIKGYIDKSDVAAGAARNIRLDKGDTWFDELIQRHSGDSAPDVRLHTGDVAIILQSGGTTGTPRGIMLTHRAVMAEAMQVRAWIKPLINDWDDITLLNLPLFHVFGNVAVMSVSLLAHNTMALVPDPRDHEDLLATIQEVKPALFPGVPTLFNAIARHPDVLNRMIDFKSIKLCISGASRLSQEVKDRFTQVTGLKLIQGYGLTETSAAILVEPVKKHSKPGSVGLPLPDVAVRIVDSQDGLTGLASGKEGEILIMGPQLMSGFWNSLEETAEMLHDGWLYTGDIGYMDRDGYVFVTARKKELIKVSGFQVWPYEIVQVIKTHPAVADVCVRGIPDEVQGESVKAWVVLHAGSQLSEEELKAHCRKKLTAYKVPRYIEFRSELPRSLYGQELCRKLVEEEKAKIAVKVKA